MAKKKLAPLPRLESGEYTALQVLRHVRQLAKREPKRLDMSTWLSMFRGKVIDALYHDVDIPGPACGTVACLAGWINISTGHYIANRGAWPDWDATRFLGLSKDNADGFATKPGASEVVTELHNLFGMADATNEEALEELNRIMVAHRKILSSTIVKVR